MNEFKFEKIPFSKTDKVVETFSMLLLCAGVLFISLSLPRLPDTIPSHFTMKGDVNGYGSKYILWSGCIIAFVMYVLLFVMERYPRLHKKYSEKNRQEQYRLTVKLIRYLRLGLMIFFTALIYFMVQSAQLQMIEYSVYLFPLAMLMIYPVMIYYLIKMGRVV